MKRDNFLKIAKVAVKIAEDKKGENIVLLDVKELTEITNYLGVPNFENSAYTYVLMDIDNPDSIRKI